MVEVLSAEHHAATIGDVSHGQVPQKRLIPLLMRLKWTLWKRSFRKNIGKLIGTGFGVLYALGGLALLVMMMLGATLWSGEGETFPLIVRGLGAVTTLLWLLLPMLAFGLDDTLDARLFALFPRSGRELQPGVFAASVIGFPAVLTIIAVLIATVFEVIWLVIFGQGALWIALAILALLPANLIGIGLCILLPRAWFAHSATRSTSRKGREAGGIIALMIMLGSIYGGSLLLQNVDAGFLDLIGPRLPMIATAAAWTPFGAAFAIPMDLAEGAVLTAVARALITTGTIIVVWLWWRRSLDIALTSALSGDASSGTMKTSALVPRWLKPSPLGAAAGRALRYWRRDTRYYAAISVMPLVMGFLAVLGAVNPDSRVMALSMVVFMTGMTGITLSNEVGFDGPAGWVNITANIPARANLLGRVIALALMMMPLMLVFGIALPLLYGMSWLLPLLLLGMLGVSLTGWGVSMAVGAYFPYPASQPGTNPMKDKSSSSSAAMLTMSVAMLGVAVPQLPAVGVAIWGLIASSSTIQLVAGIMSLLIGAIVFAVGLQLGARRLDRHYADVFQKVCNFL